MLKNILVISYYWPPSGGPGVQRVLKFSKYLKKLGWEPIVLTAKDGDFPVKDYSLNDDAKTTLAYFVKSISLNANADIALCKAPGTFLKEKTNEVL